MSKGFTLVEVIVAISVLTIGVVGVYALVPAVIRTISINTSRFTAAQFAREGIELVRNIRDANWLNQVAWNTALDGCVGGCEIAYNEPALVNDQDRFLKMDSNGFHNYTVGQDTKFKRRIIITPQGDGLNVKAQIFWTGESVPLEVEENLYDWR